jgi:hypothetical protein
MSHYALVNDQNKVVNVVLWDGKDEWRPNELLVLVCIEGGQAGIGYTYDPETRDFTPPLQEASQPSSLDNAGNAPNVIG